MAEATSFTALHGIQLAGRDLRIKRTNGYAPLPEHLKASMRRFCIYIYIYIYICTAATSESNAQTVTHRCRNTSRRPCAGQTPVEPKLLFGRYKIFFNFKLLWTSQSSLYCLSPHLQCPHYCNTIALGLTLTLSWLSPNPIY